MMKKATLRFSALALALMLLFAAVMPVLAASPSVVDDSAYVFSDSEQAQMISRLDRIADKTGWQMVVYTTQQGVGSNLNDYYNKNYYDTHSYDADALVLVYDLGSNKGTVITHGAAMDYISDERMSELGSMLRSYLDSSSYYDGVLAFADKIDEFYDEGIPEGGTYSNIHYAKDGNKLLGSLKKFGWMAGLAGLLAGVIFFFANKSRYKNTGKAGTYDLASNSRVDLRDVQDDFITQHTTVRTIQRDSSSSSGGSSGGSTHGGGDF